MNVASIRAGIKELKRLLRRLLEPNVSSQTVLEADSACGMWEDVARQERLNIDEDYRRRAADYGADPAHVPHGNDRSTLNSSCAAGMVSLDAGAAGLLATQWINADRWKAFGIGVLIAAGLFAVFLAAFDAVRKHHHAEPIRTMALFTRLLLVALAVWILGVVLMMTSGRVTGGDLIATADQFFGFGLVLVNLSAPPSAALLCELGAFWTFGLSHRRQLQQIDTLERLIRLIREVLKRLTAKGAE